MLVSCYARRMHVPRLMKPCHASFLPQESRSRVPYKHIRTFCATDPVVPLRELIPSLEVHVLYLSLMSNFLPQDAIVFKILIPSLNTSFCSRGPVSLLEKLLEEPSDVYCP